MKKSLVEKLKKDESFIKSITDNSSVNGCRWIWPKHTNHNSINLQSSILIIYFSKKKTTENVFLGREEETLEDRTLQIECAPVTTAAPTTTAAGRIFDDRQSEGKNH